MGDLKSMKYLVMLFLG